MLLGVWGLLLVVCRCRNILWFHFWTMISFIFSHPCLYPWTFLCCCVVQCFPMLVTSMVISPPGRLGKRRTWHTVCTLFSHLPSRSGLFLGCFYFPSSFSVSTNSIFEQCALSSFFYNPFSSFDFFFCCYMVQCFSMLVPSMVISPYGRSGKW